MRALFSRQRLALAMAAGFGMANSASWIAAGIPLWGPLSIGALTLLLGCALLRWTWPLARSALSRLNPVVPVFLFAAAVGVLGLWRIALDLQGTSLGLRPASVARLEGRLTADPVPFAGRQRLLVQLDGAWSKQGGRASARGRIECLAPDDGSFGPMHEGQILRVAVDQIDPGRAGISRWTVSGRVVTMRDSGDWRCRMAGIRQVLLQGLTHGLDGLQPETRGLALALLFGRQDGLAAGMKSVFYQSGCAHLVALSGMHVALVAWALVALTRPLAGVVGARLCGMVGALLFIWLVGPFPSAVRALVMFLAYQAGCLWGARVSLLSTLALSGPVICLIDPRLSQDLGYLLSFYALLGILLVQAEWKELLRRGLKPWLAGELAGGMAAQCATTPLLLLRGMPVCLQGFLASLALGPLSLLYLGLSGLALVAGLVWGTAGSGLVGHGLDLLYRALLSIGRLFVV